MLKITLDIISILGIIVMIPVIAFLFNALSNPNVDHDLHISAGFFELKMHVDASPDQ